MDLSKVKARLSALTTTNTKTKALWKPTAGSPQQVRIVPYKKDPSYPFVELLFHYGINNKSYLSPSSFGRPDPFVEFADKLKKTGSKEDWKTGKKFEPKMRTYVPILVRGEEHEGVKFWGFGKQVYQQLISFCSDEDYGDISDPVNGRDIVVEYTEGSGADFAKTNIRVKPNVSPVSTDKAIYEKIKNQPDLLSLFPELSYDELANILKNFLNPDTDESEQEAEAEAETEVSAEDTVVETVKPKVSTKSVTEEKAQQAKPKKVDDSEALEAQFANLFDQQ
jgi:hypothetical protein